MKNTVFVAVILTLTAFRVPTGQSNLQQRNKEVIRDCNGKANRGDIRGQNACFADQITFQGRAVTRETLLANLEDIQTTFPDYYSEIVDIIADGDVVVTQPRERNAQGRGQANGQRRDGGRTASDREAVLRCAEYPLV